MKNQQVLGNNKKSIVLTVIGVAIMIALTVTKIVPSSKMAGYSVFVGIAFFFITEAADKEKGAESGLRFHTVLEDLQKPGVIVWILLPIASGIATNLAGNLIFHGEFEAHVLERTGAILSFDQTLLLIGQVVLAAFGEEIAFRGFFLGKGMKICPFWLCAVVSSLTFAAGHLASGNTGVVLFDVAGVFIDSLIFSMIYRKSGNCVISTISHILANTAAIILLLLFF